MQIGEPLAKPLFPGIKTESDGARIRIGARTPFYFASSSGDCIINYMTKPNSRFFAVWEITGGYFYDPTHILACKPFPECVEVKPIVVLPSPGEGIKNRWGVVVRRSAISLDDDIGDTILGELQKAASMS